MAVSLLACGKVESANDASSTADANSSDAMSVADANVDAAAHGEVTVNVYVAGVLAQNVAVFYHEPDGSYIGTMMTNASGQVVIPDMPVGGAVTAPVSPFYQPPALPGLGGGAANHLSSVTGLQIGDVITFGQAVNEFDDGNTVGAIDVAMPSNTVAGATRYNVEIPCDDTSTSTLGQPLSPSFRANCLPPTGSLGAVAYAEDTNGTRVGYSISTGIGYTGTAPNIISSTTMPPYQTDVGTYVINVLNAPRDGTSIDSQSNGFRGGLPYPFYGPSNVPALDMGGNGSLSAKVAPGFYDEHLITVLTQGINAGGTEATSTLISFRDSDSPTASSPVTHNVNLTTEAPGLITGVTVTNGDTVNWTASSLACKDNPTPDSMIIIVGGTTTTPSAFGIGSLGEYTWSVLARGDTASGYQLPRIDPAVASTLWPSTTFTETNTSIIIKSESTMDYGDFRNSPNNLAWLDYGAEAVGTRCLTLGGILGGL